MVEHCSCTVGVYSVPLRLKTSGLMKVPFYWPKNFARYRIIFKSIKFLRKTNTLRKNKNGILSTTKAY